MYLKVLVLLLSVKAVLNANILALMTMSSHSHHIYNSRYLEGLADRGHNITYVGIDKYKNPPKNIRHLYIPGIYEAVYSDIDFNEISDISPYAMMLFGFFFEEPVANAYLNFSGLSEYVNIMKTEKFDLVVVDFTMSSYFLGAVHYSNAPVMGITAFGIPVRAHDVLGNPVSYSINPYVLRPYDDENMSLLERIDNFMLFTLNRALNYFASETWEQIMAKRLFGDDIDVKSIINRMNVILVNANLATDPKLPLVPGLIPVGGLHIRDPKPLPKDLQNYLDEAKDGVIYFSLGTNIPGSALKEKLQIFAEAFKRLAPVKILWKYDGDNFPGKPENVRTVEWAPQNDVLAHPNVRLFFTHAGMLSMHEALYHGVPVVALPMWVDQHNNAEKFVKQGMGEKLKFSALTTEDLYKTLKKVLDNPTYSKRAKELSAIFRDYPETPLDRAIYWTEYVIRHNGAPHIRSKSRDLYWFQNWLIDVVLVITATILTTLFIVYKFFQLLISITMKKPKEKTN